MPAAPTRRRILDAACRRIAADGVLGATLDDVRREAGASVGAVYHHFPDKQALVDAVRADVLARYQEAFAATLERHAGAREGIRAAVTFHLSWCAAHPDEARLLLEGRPAGVEDLNRGFFARVTAWWRPHVHYGAVRDLDVLLLHALWLGPAMEVTRHWLGGRAPKPTKAVAATLADAAWAALRAVPPAGGRIQKESP
jgi:AcrR family transcriptional regulator